ncbi:unnamed protein product [Calypogeia fissa]
MGLLRDQSWPIFQRLLVKNHLKARHPTFHSFPEYLLFDLMHQNIGDNTTILLHWSSIHVRAWSSKNVFAGHGASHVIDVTIP